MRSFRNRTVQKPIRGTMTSPHTAQVITSSGNHSLDAILGGGLPIGSIFLCEEDRFVTYSKVLVAYFLAEGVMSEQNIFVGSLDDLPKTLVSRLPCPLSNWEKEKKKDKEQKEEKDESEPLDKNGLRIAWRYNDLPLVNSEQASTKIGHHFTLLRVMYPEDSLRASTTLWDGSKNIIPRVYSKQNGVWKECNNDADNPTDGENNNKDVQIFHNPRYGHLIQEIQELLRDKSFIIGAKKNLCRVCLTSIGSPLWYDEHFGEDLLKFLTILMASIRNCNSVCFITMPMHLIAKYDPTLVPKIRQLVDYAVELESFVSTAHKRHPALVKYTGLVHLHKMRALNTLAVHMPETTDLAFKLKPKKFVIEKFHLPPELDETSSSSSCSGAGGNTLSGCNDASASLDF